MLSSHSFEPTGLSLRAKAKQLEAALRQLDCFEAHASRG
jgi:hypothetical protein